MIGAILRAQLLSMRWGGAGRGAVFSAITAVIWYGAWFGFACLAFRLAAAASPAMLGYGLPLGCLCVCLYWQFVPILSASMGSSLDMRKLLAYPAPHARLFLVELLLRLFSGAEMVMVLAGGVAGAIGNPVAGGWGVAFRLAPAALIFIVFNVLLASGLRSLIERLLARRKVREILVALMLAMYMAPRLLMYSGVRPKWLPEAGAILGAFGWPWSAMARAGIPGAGHSAWPAFISLCGWALAAAWFGRTQFERGLRFDASAARATPLSGGTTRTQALAERFYRFPGRLWSDPLAAIVEKELRSLARTPRFRMVFIMGFTFGLVVWLPVILTRHGERASSSSYFLPVVCAYALTLLGQVTYWNCFGFDRSAIQVYLAAPQPFSKTLLGKNIADLVFIYLEVLILIGVTVVLRVTSGWGQVAEALVVTGICSVYMLALGNVSSVNYPRALDPEQVSHGGASSRFQALIFILYPLALLPVALAYLARYAFSSEIGFVLILTVAAAIGGMVYWIAMESAVGAVSTRREAFLRELSSGDGPVVSN